MYVFCDIIDLFMYENERAIGVHINNVLSYISHPFKVIFSFPKNLKWARQENAQMKAFHKELKVESGKQIRRIEAMAGVHGVVGALMPIVLSVASSMPWLFVAALTGGMAGAQELIRNRVKRVRETNSKTITLNKEQNFAQKYLQSSNNNAEQFKVAVPGAINGLTDYIQQDASVKRISVSLLLNGAVLAAVNPIGGAVICGMSLYNAALSLYDLNALKDSQRQEVGQQNNFRYYMNNLVDAGQILRETNNIDWATQQLNKNAQEAFIATEKLSAEKEVLGNKKLSFLSIGVAVMYGASFMASVGAGGASGSLSTAAIIFAAGLIAADRVAQASSDLVLAYAEKVNAFRQYKNNMDKINELHSNVKTGQKTLDTSRGRLQIKNADYIYDTGRGVRDVSLDFAPGKVNVITGESGSGKSTLFSLLKHDLDCQKGAVLIDGVDVRDLKKESVNNQISFIAQKPVFLKGSIRDEMLLFNKDATDQDIKQVLAKVGLQELPLDGDTYTADGKPALSGGQMQRLAIARALLKKSPILLMDEPTANLDSGSKQEAWDTIQSLRQDKTIVIVSHDAFEILNADDVVVLEHGALTEQGSPKSLLEKGSPYLKEVEHRAKEALSSDSQSLQSVLRLFSRVKPISIDGRVDKAANDESDHQKTYSVNKEALDLLVSVNANGKKGR